MPTPRVWSVFVVLLASLLADVNANHGDRECLQGSRDFGAYNCPTKCEDANQLQLDCLFCPCTCYHKGVDCSPYIFGAQWPPLDMGEANGEAPGEADLDTSTQSPAVTTQAPTPPPTDATTAAPGPTCPRNCGTPERGGGLCNTRNGRCRSCNDNRILVSGFCYISVSCKNRKVQSGSRAGNSCRCTQDTCNFCSLGLSSSGGIEYECRVCRDRTYLLNGTCHSSCPAHMTSSGIGSFKRRCEEPFTCFGGRLVNRSVNYGCKCPNPGGNSLAACHSCEFRAGEIGERCSICKSRQFLYQEACISQCPSIPGIISYIPGSWRRECRAPFTCTDGFDEQGQACKCSRDLRTAGCTVCRWDENGNTCLGA